VLGVAGYLALTGLTSLCFVYRQRFALLLGEAVVHDLRLQVYEHLLRLPMSFFKKVQVGKLIGRKAKYMILIADELTDISPNIQSAATGNLATNPNFQMIGMSNPASRFDPFGVFSEPMNGWDSVNVEIDMEWRTKLKGLFIRFDSIDSPNITPDSSVEYPDGFYPYLATQEKIDDALDILGNNREMAMKTTKAKAHRDVFSLAASLGYAPKDLAKLRAKADETDLTAMLEARRQAAGLTQAEVARRMGVTQSTVSRLESDRWQDIRLGELDAYLRAVG
jgi:DNA-binding transcriptional regulator YiaG